MKYLTSICILIFIMVIVSVGITKEDQNIKEQQLQKVNTVMVEILLLLIVKESLI